MSVYSERDLIVCSLKRQFPKTTIFEKGNGKVTITVIDNKIRGVDMEYTRCVCHTVGYTWFVQWNMKLQKQQIICEI